MSRTLVIKLTEGIRDAEKVNQAFTVATTAIAAGATVSMWLTGEAVYLALPGKAEEAELKHAAPLEELVDAVVTGGQLTVCSQCAKRRELGIPDLIPGTRIAGSPTYVEEILADDAQAIVY